MLGEVDTHADTHPADPTRATKLGLRNVGRRITALIDEIESLTEQLTAMLGPAMRVNCWSPWADDERGPRGMSVSPSRCSMTRGSLAANRNVMPSGPVAEGITLRRGGATSTDAAVATTTA